jgi:hypothetical protein
MVQLRFQAMTTIATERVITAHRDKFRGFAVRAAVRKLVSWSIYWAPKPVTKPMFFSLGSSI